MSSASAAFQVARVAAVVALLAAAAVVATPKGRLPLALRGVFRVMRRDGAVTGDEPMAARVSATRKFVAFLLLLAAVVLCVAG